MVSPPDEGGLKESRYKQNNIIISDYALNNIRLNQLKQIQHITRLCVGVSV